MVRAIALALFCTFAMVPARGGDHQQVSLPLLFVTNQGQFGTGAEFVVSSGSTAVRFGANAVEYATLEGRTIRIQYLSPRVVHPKASGPIDATINYMFGTTEAGWHRSVPSYSALKFEDVWPGIDVAYAADKGVLKSEFQIAPGGNVSMVKLRVEGADEVMVEHRGELVVKAGGVSLREATPIVYEEDRDTGEHRAVAGRFRLIDPETVGIEVGAYDHANRLVFDPVISYSTYVGGSGQSAATAVRLDSSYNAVIAGWTTSVDFFPTQTKLGLLGRTDAYVAKFNLLGKLIFCTFIGGSSNDQANGVAVDGAGNIYVTGYTTSTNFPVKNALQTTLRGPRDAFITELNSAGNAIIFSTYFGGSNSDQGNGIALDSSNNIFVTGDTQSTDMPVVAAIQPSNAGGQDAFVLKLSPSGASILYSTYYGGNADDHSAGIAVDYSQNPVIAGSTFSTNLSLVNPFQNHNAGNQDAFVMKLLSTGNSYIFATYLGGSSGIAGLPEGATGVAVDGGGTVYVTGTTSSVNFPVTASAYQSLAPGGTVDAFVTHLDYSGNMVYSTYLGGSGPDYANAITVDVAGNAIVTGYTWSNDFPSVRGMQSGNKGATDIFVTKLNQAGSALVYSTYFGGGASDSSAAIAVDPLGTVVISGQTMSTDFPTANANQSFLPSSQSSFLARLPVGWKPVVIGAPFTWYLDTAYSNGGDGQGGVGYAHQIFGQAGNLPIVGDWWNTGVKNLGVFYQGTWSLDSGKGDGSYKTFAFGQTGDIPVVGDWNGTGTVKAGLFRGGTWILDYSGHLSGIPTGLPDVSFVYGLATDTPVVGDWTGSGTTKVGIFRQGLWMLDSNGDHVFAGADYSTWYGVAGDLPLVGDWDGSGVSKIGVYHSGALLLDYNGNGFEDTAHGDILLNFGPPPVAALIGK